MKRIVFLLVYLAVMLPDLQASELFRWMDKAGKVNYGDTPPVDAANVERIKTSTQPAQSEDLPYETLRAQQNFPVTLYVTNGCGATCNQARAMLNKRGIPFNEKSLKTQEEIDAFYKISGSNGAPTLAIGKNYLSGFLEWRWNSELDIAGYPKTASYRQRIAQPVPSNPETPEIPSAEGPSTEDQASPAKPAEQ